MIGQSVIGGSVDKKLEKVLTTIVSEVKTYAEDQIRHIRKLAEIGVALSSEKDINRLFEMIVDEAKSLCRADAGTLYIVDDVLQSLKFVVIQNDTLTAGAGRVKKELSGLADVPLFLNGQPNHSNVSSYVALTGEQVNIPDVYRAGESDQFRSFDFSGTRKYDEKTGYRTCSMLVIPMKNHEGKIIGVLQLINARAEGEKKVIAFPLDLEDLIASLASQAAVALTNVQLVQELKDLFYAFIKSIATAIDEKSPYTGGHINRVVALTMMIADAVNGCEDGVFGEVRFSDEEREELYIAAWMHDVGKITTPEYVVDKATKLETIYDRINLVELRFALIEEKIKNSSLQRKLALLETDERDLRAFQALDAECFRQIEELWDDFGLIKSCNGSGEFLADEKLARLGMIADKQFLLRGRNQPLLSDDELENLSVRKGTLTEKERKVIENHAQMTYMITSQLPFPKHLANVPNYAAQHHEKLDGSGYCKGLTAKDLSLQSRILSVADIFEALTAKDRPYKKPMRLSQAIKILGFMKEDGHIDKNVVDLFVTSGLHLQYAQEHLNPDQIDL